MQPVNFSSKSLLIIDAIKQSRDTLKSFAMNLGLNKVHAAFHANDIFKLCDEINFDMVLLGYDLGDDKKNGQQLLEELRKKRLISRQCVVIMITAEVTQAMVLAVLEHKPNDYLAKPYALNDLKKRLLRALDKVASMHEIYTALDGKKHRKAIELCNDEIYKQSKYKHECLGIKSRQYFELQEYDKAKRIYLAYQDHPNCDWADIGLGKIALLKKDIVTAQQHFEKVIQHNPMYLSAHDLLVESYIQDRNPFKAEKILEKLISLSPRSISRVKKYAELCFQNEHFAKSTRAFFKIHDLAKNSMHKTPDNTFALSRSFIRYSKELNSHDTKTLKGKVSHALKEISREFPDYEVKVQVGLFNAQLHFIVEEILAGKNALSNSETLLENKIDEISLIGLEDIASLLSELNRHEKAGLLRERVRRFKTENKELLIDYDEIDLAQLTSSEHAQAQSAIEVGINHYRMNNFRQAIDKFNFALTLFPNHIGIKLNLLQTLLQASNTNSHVKQDSKQIIELMTELDNVIGDTSERFNRLKLKQQVLLTTY